MRAQGWTTPERVDGSDAPYLHPMLDKIPGLGPDELLVDCLHQAIEMRHAELHLVLPLLTVLAIKSIYPGATRLGTRDHQVTKPKRGCWATIIGRVLRGFTATLCFAG
jgi:hypothetical protein